MSKIWQIVLKLIVSITAGVILLKSFNIREYYTNTSTENGVVLGALGSVVIVFIIIGTIYTAITIFAFCFLNESFTLIIGIIPIPFVLNFIAGVVGILVWIFALEYLEKKLGSYGWFTAFELLVYLPMCLWIDIIAAIIEKKSGAV